MANSFTDDQVQRQFDAYSKKMSSPEEVQSKVLDEESKILGLFSRVNRLKPFLEDAQTIFALLKDFLSGRYKDVPWRVIAALAGVLLYVLTPIDLIPDVLIPFGWLDDAAVFTLALKLCGGDIEAYRRWSRICD